MSHFVLMQTDESDELVEEDVPTFKWIDYKGYKKCRNSAQGSNIIVDDRGW